MTHLSLNQIAHLVLNSESSEMLEAQYLQMEKGTLEVYDEAAISSFIAAAENLQADELEKAKKGITKLVKKTMTDKHGKRKTVYVKPIETESSSEHPTKKHAEAVEVYKQKKRYMSKDNAQKHIERHFGAEHAKYARAFTEDGDTADSKESSKEVEATDSAIKTEKLTGKDNSGNAVERDSSRNTDDNSGIVNGGILNTKLNRAFLSKVFMGGTADPEVADLAIKILNSGGSVSDMVSGMKDDFDKFKKDYSGINYYSMQSSFDSKRKDFETFLDGAVKLRKLDLFYKNIGMGNNKPKIYATKQGADRAAEPGKVVVRIPKDFVELSKDEYWVVKENVASRLKSAISSGESVYSIYDNKSGFSLASKHTDGSKLYNEAIDEQTNRAYRSYVSGDIPLGMDEAEITGRKGEQSDKIMSSPKNLKVLEERGSGIDKHYVINPKLEEELSKYGNGTISTWLKEMIRAIDRGGFNQLKSEGKVSLGNKLTALHSKLVQPVKLQVGNKSISTDSSGSVRIGNDRLSVNEDTGAVWLGKEKIAQGIKAVHVLQRFTKHIMNGGEYADFNAAERGRPGDSETWKFLQKKLFS